MTAGLVLALLLVGWAMSTVLIARERNAAQAAAERERQAAALADKNANQADRERERAEKERRRAEENLRQARKAVDRVFTRAAEELAGVPHMTEVRRALFEDAAEFYEAFLEQKSDDPEMRFEMARAYQRLAFVYEYLGRMEDSIIATRKGMEILERLHKLDPERFTYQERLLASCHTLGTRLFFAGRAHEGLPYTRKALALAEALVRQHPENPFFQSEVAALLTGMAHQLPRRRDTRGERDAHFRSALEVRKMICERFPKHATRDAELAHTLHWYGNFLHSIGRFEEAEALLRGSVETLAAIKEEPPTTPTRCGLGNAECYLARTLLTLGKFEEAHRHYSKSIALLEPVVDDFPDRFDYRKCLLLAYEGLAGTLIALERFDEADQAYLDLLARRDTPTERSGKTPPQLDWFHYNRGLIQYEI